MMILKFIVAYLTVGFLFGLGLMHVFNNKELQKFECELFNAIGGSDEDAYRAIKIDLIVAPFAYPIIICLLVYGYKMTKRK